MKTAKWWVAVVAVQLIGCTQATNPSRPSGDVDRPPPEQRPMMDRHPGRPDHHPIMGHRRMPPPPPAWHGGMRRPMLPPHMTRGPMFGPPMRRAMMHHRFGHHMGRGPTSRPSPAEMFDRMDANHDGSVTRQEFEQFHQKMREQRGGGRPATRPNA